MAARRQTPQLPKGLRDRARGGGVERVRERHDLARRPAGDVADDELGGRRERVQRDERDRRARGDEALDGGVVAALEDDVRLEAGRGAGRVE